MLFLSLCTGRALATAPAYNNPADALAHADAIKTSDNAAFVELLARLDTNVATLSPIQKWQLRYLEAWQTGYSGEFAKARTMLETIIRDTPDEAVRMHASAALVNILGYGHNYEDAYTRVDQALDQLPKVSDIQARFHLLGEASQLLAGAGQYDLAASYADQIIRDYPGGRNQCVGMYLKSHANFLGGHLQGWNSHAQDAIRACVQFDENLFADAARRDIASLSIRQGRIEDAITLLEQSYSHVVGYRYPELTAEYDALLAEAYWQKNETAQAEDYAIRTVELSLKDQFAEPLATAYQLLYQIARQRGDLREALAYHEKFMTADKERLDEIREKALAYQFVKQQVEAKKIELDEMGKKNQILQLQQALDHKAVVTSRLYIVLLLTVVASVVFWLFRLKRSQLRFMRLARRDGLTGIFNRQHFVDEAEQSLRYAAKSGRVACLILIDLDHFKSINDTFGHITGDQVLKRTVATCQKYLHSCDVFGRIGGEEFGILLPECALIQALERAEQIRQAIAAKPDDGSEYVPVSGSFGIASTTHHGYDLRRLFIAADGALYRAKNEGRNRVVVSINEHAGASPTIHPAGETMVGTSLYADSTE
ncbi:GGDEF domain-containing protein [Dyella sp. 2HG41-7]|uniref:tetratricopeptide repeat-containing diguanylate cyclase n=1 Tax=Dyella sp. 2HG41-7 TaxID=2883239 RepID=UPI001F206079|nr:GGDEF domain-containing protein [Dyella sp. 2HG41-7]